MTCAIRTCIHELLSQVTSCDIREVSFELVLGTLPGGRSNLDEFDWADIAELLSRAPFDQLESIQIVINGSVPLGSLKVKTTIRDGKLSAFQDILRIIVV